MRKLILVSIFFCVILSNCAPNQQQMLVTETYIAAKIYATLTASIPTATLTTAPTISPTITAFPTLTPKPNPQAVVKSSMLNLREGPDINYPVIQTLMNGERLSVLGQYQNCVWLKVAIESGVQGWVNSSPSYIDFPEGCQSTVNGTFRPWNGMLVLDKRPQLGTNQLKVDNAMEDDGVVLLLKEDNTLLLALYVRANEIFTLFGIPNGKTQVNFVLGKDWDGNLKKFTTVTATKKVDKVYNFITAGDTISIWTISLRTGLGSLTPGSDIPADQFPIIK
jgi:SH3-like domain-containing protein